MTARLVLPEEKYMAGYLEACKECKAKNVYPNRLRDPDEYDVWKDTLLPYYERQRKGIDLPGTMVPSTQLWLVDGDEFIGEGSIRHYLNDNLKRFGGHIGYIIRESKWGQGYGNLIMSLLMEEAKKLGIETALVTTSDTNFASAKIIENHGGVFIDIVQNKDGDRTINTKRYNVALK